MKPMPRVDVIIPALNEAQSIGIALRGIPSWVRQTIVADNGSTDETANIAGDLGAKVVSEPRRGYGAACLAALGQLAGDPPDIVVFMDADGSDLPDEMESLIAPIRVGSADLVIGSRVLAPRTARSAQPGSLTLPQRFGNALATFLIRAIWKVPCSDLGPFRAIRYAALRNLAMDDLDYGWTVQMQARAAKQGVRMVEVPVTYRKRIGQSKISGTIRGVIGAGTKILTTIGREALQRRGQPPMVSPQARLIIFSRVPKAGATKTRLIPALGEQGAADLHVKMTRHTLDVVSHWKSEFSGRAESEVRFTGGTAKDMAAHFGTPEFRVRRYVEQGEGNLGDRLSRAFDDAFCDGMDCAFAIGCDCPDISSDLIDDACRRLRSHDLVIGPAHDGGYYLIGMKDLEPSLFRDIDWGGEHVLSQTLREAQRRGLSVATLPKLGDVDEPEDLPRWHRVSRRIDECRPCVSIIIPAINEAQRLPDTIAAARQSPHIEIIVVDGGSSDGTQDVANDFGVRVIECAAPHRGRAIQMNIGARHAQSDVLLFLHADTRLPFGYLDDVQWIRDSSNDSCLAFRLAFDVVTPSLRQIERGANARSRWFGMPYGDQALVIRRDTFERMGGFPQMSVMEDYEIIRRLRKLGTVHLSRRAVTTSSRRWLAPQNGVWRTMIRHQIAILAYAFGVSTDRIAALLGRTSATAGRDSSTTIVHGAGINHKKGSAYASASER